MPTPRGFGGRLLASAAHEARVRSRQRPRAYGRAAPPPPPPLCSSAHRCVVWWHASSKTPLATSGALEGEGDEDPTGESKRSLEALLAGGDEDEPEYS